MKWCGKTRRLWIALAGAVVAGVLFWSAHRLVGGPTRQEAARLAAAEFLGVEADQAKLRHTGLTDRGYEVDVGDDGSRLATLWVNPDPVYVREGVFDRDIHEGERQLSEAAAVAAARKFATEHFPDFGNLGDPTSVKAISMGPLPAWGVVWELYDEPPPRFLAIAVDAVRGEVLNFQSRKDEESRAGRFRAKVTREEAIRIAKARTPEGWEIYSIEARMARAWRERPLGYPVWDVKVKYRKPIPVEKPVEGVEPIRERRHVLMANSYVIDAITGEVAPPPVPTSLRPQRARSPDSARITREEAIRLAAESIEKGLRESSQEGWVRTKVVSAELDTSGMWRAPDYPVWDVRLQYERPGQDGTRQARVHGRFIDGITGELVAYPESRVVGVGPEPY